MSSSPAGRTASAPGRPRAPRRPGDVVFSGASLGSAVLILLTLAGVAFFLAKEAVPALTADPEEITGGAGFGAYVLPLVFGTVVSSVLAMLVATPVAPASAIAA